MENLNQNLLVSELSSHCNFCLLKLASNELVAHSECEKEVSDYKELDLKSFFNDLFHSEFWDSRKLIFYRPKKSKYMKLRPRNDKDEFNIFKSFEDYISQYKNYCPKCNFVIRTQYPIYDNYWGVIASCPNSYFGHSKFENK